LKLEPALSGATLVVVSPDGALSQISWGALPGSQPDHYLLEDYAFAIIPVPQLLPEMLATRSALTEAGTSLFVLGDVDYNADPGMTLGSVSRSAARTSHGGVLRRWDELPGTLVEALAVRNSFRQRFPNGQVNYLTRDSATEAAFRQQAQTSRYLHVATHGFFADQALWRHSQETRRRDGDGFDLFGGRNVTELNPGLLSGLVLAGANHTVEESKDDGILTALEVQVLDLRGVGLAVLSACETGLGEMSSGEGVLGLQRAFQIAGAATTVTSLWKIPDAETQELMEEFYRRLWVEKQGKLKALRGAQLWMLEKERKAQRRKAGHDRSVTIQPEDSPAQASGVSPKSWAAFVLSGDWR